MSLLLALPGVCVVLEQALPFQRLVKSIILMVQLQVCPSYGCKRIRMFGLTVTVLSAFSRSRSYLRMLLDTLHDPFSSHDNSCSSGR